jgi:tetratricopeptide (TPR) repeat protein
VLKFENLSGDAKLDWISVAAAKVLAAQLTGAPHALGELVPSISDAYGSGATEVVHGYFDGAESFHVSVEDLATHKMVSQIDARSATIKTMGEVARSIDSQALPFSTASEDALKLWATGGYEQAVAKEPGFSAAWLGWVDQLARSGDSAKASEVAQRALHLTPALASPVDTAQIEVLAATLSGDLVWRSEALGKLAQLIGLDGRLWQTEGDVSMLARNFRKAAEAYEQAAKLPPASPNAWNMLGYAQAYAGDLDKARASLAEYAKIPNQQLNALDSLGEINFISGKFAEAREAFLEAYKKNPTFLNGADLAKSAYAQWFAGDHDGADKTVGDFLAGRAKANDPLMTWRQAVWWYSTGRQEKAREALEIAVSKPLASQQLAVWKSPPIPGNLGQLKQAYEHTAPAQDGLVRTFYAAALLEAGNKEEARKLTQWWPVPEAGGDPLFQAFLFPKFLEVRKALGQ